jgi:hypothetical protein
LATAAVVMEARAVAADCSRPPVQAAGPEAGCWQREAVTVRGALASVASSSSDAIRSLRE